MYIGFFDSGIGGSTVLAEAMRQMPDESYLYFADSRHVPYGEKTKEDVLRYVQDGVAYMAGQGLKALVIACNTATSIAVRELRQQYAFPIIGMEPAVKPAVARSLGKEKRVLVTATNLTLKETKFQQLVSTVDPYHIVDSVALPGLVEFAERQMFDGPEVEAYLGQALAAYKLSQYGTVVLGCTHFPLFASPLRRLLPADVDLIDGAKGTVTHLRGILEREGLRGGETGIIQFASSGNAEVDQITFEAALRYVRELQGEE